MKKKLFLILFTCLSLISCNNDEHGMFADGLTEADAFVASEKHQEYQMLLNRDRKMMDQVKKTMSKENQKKYTLLLDSAKQAKTPDVQDKFICVLTQLTGVDFNKRYTTLYIAQTETFLDVNFSRVDYIRAIQRHNARVFRYNGTRSSSNESLCMANCEHSYLIATSYCNSASVRNWNLSATNPNDTPEESMQKEKDRESYNEWCDYRSCMMSADSEREQCESGC